MTQRFLAGSADKLFRVLSSLLRGGLCPTKQSIMHCQRLGGGHVVEVPPQYTSQRCSSCQPIDAANRQSQEKFACIKCHRKMNADVNAAKNILAAGCLAQHSFTPAKK